MFPTSLFSLHITYLTLQTLSFISNSHVLSTDDHPFIQSTSPKRHIQKRETDFDPILAADNREFVDEFSPGVDVPNSWLYKFPPWFLPHNPPPDGFYANRDNDINSHLDSSEEDPQHPADGDVVILSDLTKSDRSGRLQNIKVPGNSRFRDEIVKTLVDITVGRSSGVSPLPVSNSQVISSGISIKDVTPAVLVKSPQTPSVPVRQHTGAIRIQQAHGSTIDPHGNVIPVNPPSDLQNIIIHSQPAGNKDFNFRRIPEPNFNSKNRNQHLVISSQSVGDKDLSFHRFPEQDTSSKNRHQFVIEPSQSVGNKDLINFQRSPETIAISQTRNSIGFRPSPPDLSHTAGSSRFTQNPSLQSNKFNGFRPSSLTASSGDHFRQLIFQSSFGSFGKQLPIQDHQTSLKFRQPSLRFEDSIQTLENNEGSQFNSQEHQQLKIPKSRPILQHNRIENGFVKNSPNVQEGQGNDFSSYATLIRHQDSFDNKSPSLWVPSVPNIVPPPFQQRGLLQSVTSGQQSEQFRKQIPQQSSHHEGNQRFRNPKSIDVNSQFQNNRANLRPSASRLPTSIQDIINSDIDNSQVLLQRAREQQPISPFSTPGEEDAWLWTRFE